MVQAWPWRWPTTAIHGECSAGRSRPAVPGRPRRRASQPQVAPRLSVPAPTVLAMTSRGSLRSTTRVGYRCTECGWTAIKWVGRCGGCRCWGTLEQAPHGAGRSGSGLSGTGLIDGDPRSRPAVPIGEVDVRSAGVWPTGIQELDRVLGGGLAPGGTVLVAGEPGIGKSTLLLAAAASAARQGRRVLYVSAEESTAQVRSRAGRIGAVADGLFLAADTDLAAVLGQVALICPDLLVVDSVQTVASESVDGAAGNVAQVREVAGRLSHEARGRAMAALLVGHVTKDGAVAGPRTLEHLVDVVLHFEGDRHGQLRVVRAAKNRFGPTDEVGCFEMTESGMAQLADPAALFLSAQQQAVPGTCVTVTLDGRRPLVIEVQALVTPTTAPSPRRTTSGIDSARVAMLLAVLDRHARLRVRAADCYVATVGGLRICEPSADLATALALAGSVLDQPLPVGTVAFGEVGLAGELRAVGGIPRRLAEARRLGFTRAVLPSCSVPVEPPAGLRLHPVADVAAAVRAVLGAEPTPAPHSARAPTGIGAGG